MNPRFHAIATIAERKSLPVHEKKPVSERFESLVFHRALMQKVLAKEVYETVIAAMDGFGKVSSQVADTVALALKDWAMNRGATHFCHWFQPLTGVAAEKHDAFIDWENGGSLIEKFTGKHLLRGEPDASSFPSGGLRHTAEARGYSAWDPTTPAFLWRSGERVILCIPTVFFSWTGCALDTKIPLMRSDAKINQAALRLTKLLNIPAKSVFSTLGCEQEYFLVDRSLFLLRPDLVLTGRTLQGASASKSQELEDHYFRTVKERVLSFMQDFEDAAWEIGIPLKTRHNEVAPGQFEVAPIFEKASLGVDHNVLLMELMRQIAPHHHLACLLHEKPFAGINGSGKHNNWSLSTDTGVNLLDPKGYQGKTLGFLLLLTAVLSGVHAHGDLLLASIASANNDHRLGGHEAPPAILSVYLGEALEKLLEQIEKGDTVVADKESVLDLGIPAIPELPKDRSDRNRTSPFAFTGNKFEFRSVGSSAHCGFPVTLLNSIVADSLSRLLDEVEGGMPALSVIQKSLRSSKAIRFSGDNYSPEWKSEAKRRGLPIMTSSLNAYEALLKKSALQVFHEVYTEEELKSRYHVLVEHYKKIVSIESKTLLEMFQTQVLPAAMQQQKQMADSLHAAEGIYEKKLTCQRKQLYTLTETINRAIDASSLALFELRSAMDTLETMIDDELWPLPKYRELLHLL